MSSYTDPVVLWLARLIPGVIQAGRLSLPETLPRGVTWSPGSSEQPTVYAAATAATAAIAGGIGPSPSLMLGTVPLQRSTSTSSAPAEVRIVGQHRWLDSVERSNLPGSSS